MIMSTSRGDDLIRQESHFTKMQAVKWTLNTKQITAKLSRAELISEREAILAELSGMNSYSDALVFAN